MKRLSWALLLAATATLNAFGSVDEPGSGLTAEESEAMLKCSTGTVSDYVDRYLVRLEKTAPDLVPFKENFTCNYIVTAKDKIKKVVVEDQIPAGATYVSSSPNAQVDGDVVTWTLYNLEKGESISLELVMNASKISDFTGCATVIAYPEACTTTTVGMPVISIEMTTPSESVLVGSDVVWTIALENSGNICAKDIILTDTLTEGLSHASGNNDQILELGTLAPGEKREIYIDTKAAKSGSYCSVATVTGSNLESVKDKFCFVVLEKGIEVDIEGPKKQFVGKRATYTISVVNTGDVPFKDVIITDTVPAGARLLSAPGAEVRRDSVEWTTDLAAGEEKTFEIDLSISKEGNYCNEVSVSAGDSGLESSAKACTEWRGYPALLIEVIDTQDPIVVGGETTYIVQIANQGTAADTNIKLEAQVPEGMSIVSAGGDTQGAIKGNKISFAPYPVLNAKEIIQFRIVAKAVETGDLRFKAQVSSDLLKLPVPEEESTQAY